MRQWARSQLSKHNQWPRGWQFLSKLHIMLYQKICTEKNTTRTGSLRIYRVVQTLDKVSRTTWIIVWIPSLLRRSVRNPVTLSLRQMSTSKGKVFIWWLRLSSIFMLFFLKRCLLYDDDSSDIVTKPFSYYWRFCNFFVQRKMNLAR